MGLLRSLRLRGVGPRARRQVLLAVLTSDVLPRLRDRARADHRRVGPHVGDETHRLRAERQPLVELLRHGHRLAGGEPQLAPGLLLQRTRDERRRRPALRFALLHRADGVDCAAQVFDQRRRRLFVVDFQLALFALHRGQRRVEALDLAAVGRLLGKVRQNAPILDGHEVLDLTLAFNDDAERDGLYPPRREAAAHLLAQQRAETVADEPVEDAPRLLGVHQIDVDLAGMLESRADGRFRDLVEHDAADGLLPRLNRLAQVPRDGLALTVGVGRQIQCVGFLHRLVELFDQGLLILGHDVLRLEVVLDVDAERALGKVADVTDGCFHVVVAAKKAPDSPGLGRRLDDHKVLCHSVTTLVHRFTSVNRDAARRAFRFGSARRFGKYNSSVQFLSPSP